jgi:lipopolysaccharide/colanic/teichoic acid biosynthesis glycosyltransferase
MTREINIPSPLNDLIAIADEASFRRLLFLELKRSERTGAGFLLLVLTGGNGAIEKLGIPLTKAFRETDFTGWYELESSLGVICTSLNGASQSAIKSALTTRIADLLARHLHPDQIQQVELAFHFFPEEEETGPIDTRSTRVLHPDRRDKQLSQKLSAAVKRATDIVGSLMALVVLSPVFLIISAGIKLTSSGPVFFRQKRLGKEGVDFTFLKFRSMYVANDPLIHREYTQNLIRGSANSTTRVFKIQNDPRVTCFGRFLRISSLDELPQFINVLSGTMSLVGPRPPIQYEYDCYKLWHRRRVHEAKPGMTGVWQVNGRSRTTFDEMVRMDLQYIRDRSFWYDLKILFKTPFAVISRDGAY